MKLHWIRERCRAGWALGVIAAVGVGVCGAGGCGGDEATSPPPTDTTGGDASTPVPPGPTGPTCTAPKTVCGEGCVDLQTDFGNCGGCGKSCVAGQVCAGGACALACAGGATKCGDACVDTQVDPNNCGACGTKCGPGLVCSAGLCGLTCTGDLTMCGGGDAGGQAFCANVKEDNDNCGACGTKCTGKLRCLDGACVDNCSTGADCPSSARSCSAGQCVVPKDCSEIKLSDPAAPSGAYTIDPDGAGGGAAFTAYCDMITDGGGWTIVASMSGADGEEGLTSDTEASGDPLAFAHYNMNRAKKVALSAISQESIFVRQDGRWIKADKPMFDADLAVADKDKAFAVKLNGMNGAITDQATTYGFMAWSNHAIDGGGDFALSSLKDGTSTCNGGVTADGVDHHNTTTYLQLNCSCQGDYLYSYSNVAADGDASYKAGTPLGGWTSTAGCTSSEGGGLVFYAAMRRPLTDYASCKAMHAALPSAPSGWYLIDPDGAAGNPPLGAYCDMVTDGGGYTEVPVNNGISTKNKDEANSCQALGLEIGVARTLEHHKALLAAFGAGYFETVPGVYGEAAVDSTGCAMNSGDAVCAANWKAIDNGAWFARSEAYTEPNGNYTPGCWLKSGPVDEHGWKFDDWECNYATGGEYVCSDNAK